MHMQGKRVEIVPLPDGGYAFLNPGEYAKLPDGYWIGHAPNGAPANLRAHSVTEHEDGTITVSPSIEINRGNVCPSVPYWHGYLERGVWRSC